MDFRKSFWLAIAAGVTGLLLIFLSTVFGQISSLYMIGALVIFAGVIQGFIFFRCPHCGATLMGIQYQRPKFCPQCSKALDWCSKET